MPEIGSTGSWGIVDGRCEGLVHLVVDALGKIRGAKPEFLVVNLAAFEREYKAFDIETTPKKEAAFNADTVIVALGENAPPLVTGEAKASFKEAMVRLLTFPGRRDSCSD